MKKFLIGLALVLISSIGYCGETIKEEKLSICNKLFECEFLLTLTNPYDTPIFKKVLKFKNNKQFIPGIFNNEDEKIVTYSTMFIEFSKDKKGKLLKDWNGKAIPKAIAVSTVMVNCKSGIGKSLILNVIFGEMDDSPPLYENEDIYFATLKNQNSKLFEKSSLIGQSVILACDYVKNGDDINRFIKLLNNKE